MDASVILVILGTFCRFVFGGIKRYQSSHWAYSVARDFNVSLKTDVIY